MEDSNIHIFCIRMLPRNDTSFSFLVKTQPDCVCVCVCIYTCFSYILYIYIHIHIIYIYIYIHTHMCIYVCMCVCVHLVTQSCLTLCHSMGCSPPSYSVIEFSRQNTEVDYHSLLQEIFPTQGSNSGLPHFRRFLYHPSYQGRHIGLK